MCIKAAGALLLLLLLLRALLLRAAHCCCVRRAGAARDLGSRPNALRHASAPANETLAADLVVESQQVASRGSQGGEKPKSAGPLISVSRAAAAASRPPRHCPLSPLSSIVLGSLIPDVWGTLQRGEGAQHTHSQKGARYAPRLHHTARHTHTHPVGGGGSRHG